jgi:V8-like Glu-specific endopeptidase
MTLEQQFPVSLEGQFLATGATAGTQTGNVCTPGTHIEVNGERTHAHIIDSSSRLFPSQQWVAFEAEVHGNDEIIYRVNGDEVLRYSNPILDPEDPDAKRLIDAGANLQLSSGHIVLQAEGHPVLFCNIMIKPLNH